MRLDETYIPFDNPADQLEKGLQLCQRGDWEGGLEQLRMAAERMPANEAKPSRYYSYLGYAIALREKRIREGIKLCQYAIKQEFYQPENYFNLAQTYLLGGNRSAAWKVVAKGLKVDANFPLLQELHHKLGERRPPVLPFLSRSNFLNQILGRMRYSMQESKRKAQDKKVAAQVKKSAAARQKAAAKRPAHRPPGKPAS